MYCWFRCPPFSTHFDHFDELFISLQMKSIFVIERTCYSHLNNSGVDDEWFRCTADLYARLFLPHFDHFDELFISLQMKSIFVIERTCYSHLNNSGVDDEWFRCTADLDAPFSTHFDHFDELFISLQMKSIFVIERTCYSHLNNSGVDDEWFRCTADLYARLSPRILTISMSYSFHCKWSQYS